MTTRLVAALGVASLIYALSMFAAVNAIVVFGIYSDFAVYLFFALLVGGPILGVAVGWRIWRRGQPPVAKGPVPGWAQKLDEE